jgi:hypothetical protein
LVLAGCGVVSAIAVVAAATLLIRSGSEVTQPAAAPHAATEQFDPSVVPLVTDDDRRVLASYAGRPDFKALAIAPRRVGVAEGARDIETARQDALRRCNARSEYECRLYASGMDVVWSTDLLPLPSSEDLRTEPTDHPLVASDVPLIRSASRKSLERYLKAADHRAVALTAGRIMVATQRGSRAEAGRLVVDWCGGVMRKPCLLLSVDGFLTIGTPKSRTLSDIFLPSTQGDFAAADRERIVQAYRGPEWRALARGSKGTWHPVAGAPSEIAAIDAAMAACAKVDESCQLFAIGNFLVSKE